MNLQALRRTCLAWALLMGSAVCVAQTGTVDISQLGQTQRPRSALPASAQPAPISPDATVLKLEVLVMGRDFIKLPVRQRTTHGALEVIFFFHFDSPWSQQAWPVFEAWQRAAPGGVRLTAAPVVLDDTWGYGARVYYALEAMERLDLVPRIVAAMALGEVTYARPVTLKAWLEGLGDGFDAAAFQEALNSPMTIARATNALRHVEAYALTTVPSIVVDGQYVFAARQDAAPRDVVDQAKFMVEQLQKGGARP